MASSKTITYPDALYLPALLQKIDNAQSSVQIMTFLFKTSYAGETGAKQVKEACKRAAARGVKVLVLMNYSRFEPDVAAENYATAQELAAAGCYVKLGPRNRTLHTKMCIVDLTHVFIGSHNLTRGALTFNYELTVYSNTLEMRQRAIGYFNAVWRNSTFFADSEPPAADWQPIQITLQNATVVGEEIELAFTVNHATGVDAFAAVSDDELNLEGANMGATVGPDLRVARVTPMVEAGQTVHVAVRAYHAGTVEATSNIVSMIYQPGETGGGGDPGGGGGGGEPPPPEPLTAPTVTSVTPPSPTTVTVAWTFAGADNFQRFAIQQRNLGQVWQQIGVVMDPAAREWTGSPNSIDTTNPFRVVVYNTLGESATSNEVLLTLPPLTAPVLTSVVRATGNDVTATWEFTGATGFHRFEIQRRDLALIWVTLGTVMDETARQWTGAAANTTEAMPFRVVVFNMAEESAASNAMALAPLPALTAPTLTTLYRVGAMGLHVDWTHAGVTDFARFELQQRQTDAVTWTAFATITDPTARSWEVDFVQYRDGTHPVRVTVFDTYGQTAASNEVSIGGPDAPHIESVATASGTTVNVQWTWSGQDFQSYIVQQQDAQQTWHDLAQLFAQTPMQWTGVPTLMQAGRPFRVVVNAGTPSPVAVNSNEVPLVAGPPPAPVLGVITPAPLPSVHVPWTWTGALNFQRFVIQQRNGAMVWQDLATITDPATVDWTGQMLMGGQAWPFHIVVYLTTGESATSAMGYITQT